MEEVQLKLAKIMSLLKEVDITKKELGLFEGKMGLAIFYYNLSRFDGSETNQDMADEIIGDIYETIGKSHISSDFESGLAGIAWGLIYLVKNNYVDADLEETLSDVDDKIYKNLIDQLNEKPFGVKTGLLGYLLYYIYRLENLDASSHTSTTYIFQRIVFTLINRISQLIEEEKFQLREPALFTIYWDLPILMIVLGKLSELNLFNSKVDRILEFLGPLVKTIYPSLDSNKFYLMLGIESVLKHVNVPGWRNHAVLLRTGIDYCRIWNHEFKSLNIFVVNGVSGLMMICQMLNNLTGEDDFILEIKQALSKISNSEFWKDIEIYKVGKENIGLVSGLSGIGLALINFGLFDMELKNKK